MSRGVPAWRGTAARPGGQVYNLLGELQQLLEDGTPRAQVIEKVEGYKDRLAELI